jgi:hypothetical protein
MQLFRSQHGRTYYMCVLHVNLNKHTVNPEDPCNGDGPYGSHARQSDESNGDGDAPMADNCGPGKQQIKHPHLSGMCPCCIVYHPLIIKVIGSPPMQCQW